MVWRSDAGPRALISGLVVLSVLVTATAAAPGKSGGKTSAATAGGAKAAAPSPAAPAAPEWVARSNANAQILLNVMARFQPEQAGSFGVSGIDDQILDLKPGVNDRFKASVQEAVATLEKKRDAETDPAVKQDLAIMIKAAGQEMKDVELSERLEVPYADLHRIVFRGLSSLLDDQVPEARRAHALVRLRRYAGLEQGYEPIAKLATDRTREKLSDPKLIGPARAEVERDLASDSTLVAGIGELFAKYKIAGYEKPLATLKEQLAGYQGFVKAEILPRARTDFRLPAERYALNLEEVGVDMPVDELQSRAQVAFREIQNEMQALAPRVAAERGITASDYRDVLRALKQKQLVGDAILAHYQSRIKDVEQIIRDQRIVTLPKRPMQVKVATEAETAIQPAPNLKPPRLIGNTGEAGTFMLPLHMPANSGGPAMQYDDFTYEAASWTLTAHEGRPGHELQFSSIVEKGVSIPRVLFAFNSVNVEGWALYAEAELKPYEPLDGQLVALQNRLLRAARAYLDPGLQAGTITPDVAKRVLEQDVVLSPAMAKQELERYMFRAPGQATSYFCGYQRLMELRTETERALGPRFDRQRYHDFVLAQGLLPPDLLAQSVREQFVPGELAAAGR